MNITFTPQPIPELTLASGALGFATGTPLQLTLQHHQLWITVVIDEAVVPPEFSLTV